MKNHVKSLAKHLPHPTAAAMKPGKPLLAVLCLAALSLTARAQQADAVSVIFEVGRGSSETHHYPKDTTQLDLSQRELTGSVGFSRGWTNLKGLDLSGNDLQSLTLREDMTSLEWLNLANTGLQSLTLPEGLMSLKWLNLASTGLRSLTLPKGMTNLEWLNLSNIHNLRSLPEGLTGSLKSLYLSGNRLESLTLPKDMTNLEWLDLSSTHNLQSLTLPEGLTNLKGVDLGGTDDLRSLTLPEDMTSLRILDLTSAPIGVLRVPRGFNLSELDLRGFFKDGVTYYGPPPVEPPAELEFMLQWADSVEGPWMPLVVSDGVVRLPNEGGKRFFRLAPAGEN
ncbi:MAG: hypothetical protein M2R46_03962 [Verrucomicrobia subdivision 3 bacterium]|nr:hypothetical protein [Limisphaerales bacterium]